MSQIYEENGIDVAVADSDPIENRHCERNAPMQRPVADTKCELPETRADAVQTLAANHPLLLSLVASAP